LPFDPPLSAARLSTGVAGLDAMLGGGLLPGTLSVVVGATGSGKTQLGVQFAQAGLGQEGRRGILFDMACRGDSQSHAEYARRMFGWAFSSADPAAHPDLAGFFAESSWPGDYLHVFDYQGRRVTRRDLDTEAWRLWQAELARKLGTTIAFFYGNFVRGVHRAVVDGIEPSDRASESIQLDLFEYLYHQVLRKDPEWVARDLFRQDYRAHAAEIAARRYDPGGVACLLLVTSHETMLDDLISRPLVEGDVLANANTVVYLGKVREGPRLARALYIPKHRGSACSDDVTPYRIGDSGVEVG
jgi:KaiC/GvpD/RAD55 family RecA-like ATPase